VNFSEPFIRKPVATTVIMSALVIFGWFAYQALPVNELPNIDFPTITVTGLLPGADPETMASTVATPIEKQLSTIAGIDSMSSINTSGQTIITIQFTLDRDIDAAAQDVESAISQSLKQLPVQMTTPPSLKKVNPSLAPILYLALTADHLPLSKLDDYAETFIAENLSMVSGVAEVDVYGSQQYAVRLMINPNAIAEKGLDIETISSAIVALSTNQPSGLLETQGRYHLIEVDGQLNNAKEFSEAIVANVNGAPVRIKDIGYAVDSVANDKVATWYNHQRGIVLAIQRQPGTNTIEIVDNIYKILPDLLKKIPGDVKLHVLSDHSVFVRDAVQEVKYTLIFSILLVLLVTYLFFNNFYSTLITALDFPTSLVATFAVMYLLGYSLDNLSLMGLVLAVGFVIDDTIVVIENILRYLESGVDRFTATLQATQEICFTVISMTLSLAAVFLPILFMQGLLGRLFHEFAVVVGTAIIFSGFIALTLTPMLRSRFLVAASPEPDNIVVDKFNKGFEWSKNFYINSLRWAVDHTTIVWVGSFIILALTVWLGVIVPKGFIPTADTGIIFCSTQVQEELNFDDFIEKQQKVVELVLKNPNVNALMSTVGQSGASISSNTGTMVLQLKPLNERSKSADEVIMQLRGILNEIPGIKVFLQNPPSIKIGAISSTGTYQYVIQGTDWEKLQEFSNAMLEKIIQIPGVVDANTDLILKNPEIHMHILRDRAAALGITPLQIENVLYESYGTDQINTIITPINQYPVIIEVDPKYQKNIADLNSLQLKSPTTGGMVPLNTVANLETGTGPLAINHYGQLPAVTLSFNIIPGASLGSITEEIEALALRILPQDISGTFAGSAKTFSESTQTLPILLLFTVFVIYMVLAILYEHFLHPLTILTALPFAAFGALLALYFTQQELNIFSFIGIIMLVGLVKKNGIIMIDFALETRKKKGFGAREAILEACEVRYRPIMMTTLAAILSTLPLALGTGSGSETRQPLGIAVVGGLLFSQMLTLYITPVFYLTMEKFIDHFKKPVIDKP